MDQITKLISGLSIAQRISIVVAALTVVLGITWFSHWKREGDFHPLYTSMAPEDAAAVVQKLKETGVEYRLADNGGSVLVPSGKLAESRLALASAGLPKSGRIGFELFDKTNFGATEFVEHINYQRALEGELERSVMSLAEVEQSRVHLTLPKESVFTEQQQPAKASVMVKLRAGAHISAQNVVAVTNLVASAVQGLTPDAVSVVDMDGTLLSRPRRSSVTGAEMNGEALEVRQQIERGLVAKINETLEPLLGPNGFRAGASVDCDLTSGEQQEEILDPARTVMVSSQKTEEAAERPTAGGIPGTASNLPAPPAQAARTVAGTTRRTENIAYQSSRTVRRTNIPQGIIKRMSLSILVGQTVRWDGDGKVKQRVLVPPDEDTLKKIRELIAGVTGFSTDRGDQLIVETLPFESSRNAQQPDMPSPVPATPLTKDPPWLQYLNRYRALWVPVGIGVVVLLVVIFALFKRMRKRRPVAKVSVPGELPEAAGLHRLENSNALATAGQLANQRQAAAYGSNEDENALAERIQKLVERDPNVTANVLRMWLQENRTEAEVSR